MPPKAIIDVLPDADAVFKALGHVERTLSMADCPEFDYHPGDVAVRIDRVVAYVDRPMTRLQLIGLGSTLMELLAGGGEAVVSVPFRCMTTNIGRVLVGSGLERVRVLVSGECSWFVFKRNRTSSTWNVEWTGVPA